MRSLASCLLLVVCSIAAQAQTRPPTPPPARDTTTSARPGRQSWTSDRATFGVGDVVTILIDERTLASAHLTENHADRRTKDLGADISPPASGGVPASPIAASVSLGSDGKSRRTGEASRDNAFITSMSARVVAVSSTGELQISGRKVVTVDKSKQEVAIQGWIRAQDISPSTNSVASARIADAEISYVQQGNLGKPKSSILGRLLGAIWP